MTTILTSTTPPANGTIPAHADTVSAGTPADVTADWRREAALRLGASPEVARHFGATGLIELAGQPLSLHPLHDEPTGPWLAVTRAARPAAVDEAAWCDALLLATGQALVATHAAFGLNDDGEAVLILRTAAGHAHPDLLAVELAGLLQLRQALLEGVTAQAGAAEAEATAATAATVATAGTAATAGMSGTAEAAAGAADAAQRGGVDAAAAADVDAPCLEAPERVLVRVHGALLQAGLPAADALAGARSGSFTLDGVPIGLACEDGTDTLVLVSDLGAEALDTLERRRLALQANTTLMVFAGVAVARERGRARLMSRCPVDGRSAADFADGFAAWLRDFARLARATSTSRDTAAAH
ncbi:hypothetical protein [Mitsuaria sp. BK037]|uniref:hypothetical protein n=1 Tax=Mitsuaria sp. BK037 TaxID=2587122 RepID=UPI001615F20B|nr:hypothetical protein [Mitsuaria sp. BK037]MBB3281781.1 hypothetical protein [Mitsuaria sp. BK037]